MADGLFPLIDVEEVEHILDMHYMNDEDMEANIELLMAYVEDGSIIDFIVPTFDSWYWHRYWEEVEQAVMAWADDIIYKSNNTDRE